MRASAPAASAVSSPVLRRRSEHLVAGVRFFALQLGQRFGLGQRVGFARALVLRRDLRCAR